jgi:hypothetical protein
MWHLIGNAEAIAALVPLVDGDFLNGDVELRCFYGSISPKWFKDHLGHDLIPISEYGDFGTPK